MSDSDSDTDTDMYVCDGGHSGRGKQAQQHQQHASACDMDWECEAAELAEEEAALEVKCVMTFHDASHLHLSSDGM